MQSLMHCGSHYGDTGREIMARFTAGGGEDDGEGPSEAPSKRARFCLRFVTNAAPERRVVILDDADASGEEERQQEDDGNGAKVSSCGDGGGGEGGGGRWVVETEEDEDEDEDSRFGRWSGDDNPDRAKSKGSGWERPITVTLTDPDVLDCFICCEPLSVPVFQCDNGHIACSLCCTKLRNKCPSCQMPIGYSRCRAIEKVLESIKISCQNAKYGCRVMLGYGGKYDHEIQCIFAPLLCPLTGCDFFGSTKQLTQHFRVKHAIQVISIRFSSPCIINLKKNESFKILHERDGGNLFILSSSILNSGSTHVGNLVAINHIASSLSTGNYMYRLIAENPESSIKVESVAGRVARQADIKHGFFLFPPEFSDKFGWLTLKCSVHRVATD